MGEAENGGVATLHLGMVALDDPAGITMDLNGLIKQRTAEFTEEPQRKWKHESALTINMFKRAIQQGAVKDAEGMAVITTAVKLLSYAERHRPRRRPPQIDPLQTIASIVRAAAFLMPRIILSVRLDVDAGDG